MSKSAQKITPEQYEKDKKIVLSLFYRTELRTGEVLIDNRDTTISKETGFTKAYVSNIIVKDLDEKFDKINIKNK